jgi:dihydrofolate reductase
MATVVIDLSISLDGFIAGPDDGKRHPLGTRGGEHVFDWYTAGGEPMHGEELFRPVGANREIVEEMYRDSGAFIFGRRTYDITDGWNGRHPVNGAPLVIVTHEPPAHPPEGESSFYFTADVADAIAKASELAGDKSVRIGGASVAQQALNAGLVDELLLHVAPIILGAGVRLFANVEDTIELELTRVVHGPGVVHQYYRVSHE